MPTSVLEEDYQLSLLEDSYGNWVADAPCAQLSTEFKGVREDHHTEGRSTTDGKNTFYYDDPRDEQGAGVLGVTYTHTSGVVAFNRDGTTYHYAFDSDIVFSKDVNWISSEDMDQGCSGTPIEAVATHEIGHQWGMGHSCEEADVTAGLCEDNDLKNANMFWSAPNCGTFKTSYDAGTIFTVDDIEGMTAIYGPYASFEAISETYGGVPLEVCFTLSSTSAIKNVEWLYGDGDSDVVDVASPDDYEVCHVYDEKGQYTINVTISGEDEATEEGEGCGEWTYTNRKRAMVVVCEPPAAAKDFDGMFTYSSVDDENLIVQMVNQADTTVYGCIDQVSWIVYDGDEELQTINAWSPKIEFPDYGEYRVVLQLGGPGGVHAEEVSITVEEDTGLLAGCSSTPAGKGLGLALLSLLGLTWRRRSQD
jgi:MYXO-CTERM domain-containing protein